MPRLGSLLSATVVAAVLTALTPGAGQAALPGPSETGPAQSARTPTPAAGHQLMLDTCNTPTIDAIRAWQRYSPFRAIAAYIPARSDYDLWACRDEPSRAT